MDTVANSNSNRALVVHKDEGSTALESSAHPAVRANEIVLDALPYVEALDPNYENYAIQLIEEELQHNNNAGDVSGEHPSLQSLLGDRRAENVQFGGRAPMASSAYESLLARKSNPNNNNNNDDEAGTHHHQPWIQTPRPDPMATTQQQLDPLQNSNKMKLLSDLHTSLSTQKIALEEQRHRLINLELQQTFQTPQTYTHYNTTQLQEQIVEPLQQTLERQRMEVDAINATRMEEQQRAMGTLDTLNRKYYELIDKNLRLGEAVAGLEGEVEGLREESGASLVIDP